MTYLVTYAANVGAKKENIETAICNDQDAVWRFVYTLYKKGYELKAVTSTPRDVTNLVTIGKDAIEEVHTPGMYDYYFNRKHVFGVTESDRFTRDGLINLYNNGYFKGV